MKDKAIEILEKCEIFKGYCIDTEVVNAMLEFGHYVAEEQKKQCSEHISLNKNAVASILNSKNVCNND